MVVFQHDATLLPSTFMICIFFTSKGGSFLLLLLSLSRHRYIAILASQLHMCSPGMFFKNAEECVGLTLVALWTSVSLGLR